jgi:hypothetical protein
MISNLEAVQYAKKYVTEVFSDAPLLSLRLEEIELDESEKAWLVTLSVNRPIPPEGSTGAFLPISSRLMLDLKLVQVDAETGKVLSVKNRAA